MRLTHLLTFFSSSLKAVGRRRAYAACHSTVRSVTRYCCRDNVTVDRVFTKRFLCGFEHHLLHELGLCRNTSSFYMNVLRSMFREAVRRKILPPQPDLFDAVFTGTDPTRKRSVDASVIRRLSELDLSRRPHLIPCCDLFILAFLLNGISFVDLAHLSKAEVFDDYIIYRRSKTGRLVTVPLNPAARVLLSRYASHVPGSSYALCLLDPDAKNQAVKYESILRRHNRHLDVLSAMLGLSANLTTYVSRHTWATIAYHYAVDVPSISESLGHRTETVTRVYLRPLAGEHLRRANQIVYEAVFGPPDKRKSTARKNVKNEYVCPTERGTPLR